MSAKSLKFFGPHTTQWQPCKICPKLNRNHLLVANIFKLHEYRTFGLMKMHNMCKIWFANKIFSLLRRNKKYFSWFFKGFQLPESVLRLLCNFAKKIIKGRHFMGHSGMDFHLLLNSKSSKLPSIVFLKICWKWLFWT